MLMSTLSTTLRTKDRIVAVDILRLLAAFLLMIGHLLYCSDLRGAVPLPLIQVSGLFCDMDAMFFVLAGFFACRNITWKKGVTNAMWCLLAFVLWTIPAWLYLGMVEGVWFPFYRGFGLTWFVFPGIPLLESTPVLFNQPLWFMRDLVFLFFFSPILAKYARYIFPALVVFSVIPQAVPHFLHTADITQGCMRPYSIGFFTAGCFFASFSAESRSKMLSYYSPWVVLVYLTASITVTYYLKWGFPCQFVKNLFGMWILYQIARLIEVYVPHAREFALKFAPLAFLCFASHYVVFMLLKPRITGWFALTMPLIDFALMGVLFFSLKRWCRPLLRPIAYYKLRPDDFPAEKGS